MCKKSNLFKFCTCEEKKNLINGDIVEDSSWTLMRFICLKNTSIRGKILGPVDDLGNGLKIETMVAQLNSNIKSFDFEYSPAENDSLKISTYSDTSGTRYFSLLFTNGKWAKGRNPVFRAKEEEIAKGGIYKMV